eukprot:TRINITY_DN2490_c0_g1_i13.p1 TRINITY_DN2490_c0_g1~~TRINITY_DN2490_c0_g1_i13.p1  ORF type:complete len:832 (+),score=149.69 TRINITY_DN2490_c0_g1_i13:88-2583(+)
MQFFGRLPLRRTKVSIRLFTGIVLLVLCFLFFRSTLTEIDVDTNYNLQIKELKGEIMRLQNHIQLTSQDVAEIEADAQEDLFLPAKTPIKFFINNTSNNSTRYLHVVSHTHWDREWYLSFEKFRRSLVQVMDDVWTLLKTDPLFYHWHPDGQMSVIEDYLQIRPKMEDHVKEAASKRFISLGPWYTQPDEFLVSGESLVRNLFYGIRTARKFGTPLMVGYLPDTFGHVSQLPQIFRGFGISSTVIGRGVKHTGHGFPSEAYWTSPDGSRVFVIYLASWYCNGLFHDRISATHSDQNITKWFNIKREKVLEKHSKIRHALLLDGCDHTGVDYDVGEVVKRGDKLLSSQNIRVVQSSIQEYVEIAEEDVKRTSVELPEYEGELFRGADVTTTLVNILSNKIAQKQDNWRTQVGIQRYAEPLNVVVWKLFSLLESSRPKVKRSVSLDSGHDYDDEMFWYAWKLLLQNHPHDSIAGCSSSEVHHNVEDRFQRSKQVIDSLFTEAFVKLIGKIKIDHNFTQPRVVIFNPTLTRRQHQLVVVRVVFLEGCHPSTSIQARDSDGHVIPSSTIKRKVQPWDFVLLDKGFRKGFNPLCVAHVAIVLPSLPSFGYQTLSLQILHEVEKVPLQDKLRDNIMENEFLRVKIEPDSVEITDLKSSVKWLEINSMNACQDEGTEYITNLVSCEVLNFKVSRKVVTPSHKSIATLARVRYSVGDKEYFVVVKVNYLLTLNSRRLDVRVAFNNTRPNWRLQTLFPALSKLKVDSAFDIVEVPQDIEYHGQQSFFVTYDGYSFFFFPSSRVTSVHQGDKTGTNEGYLGEVRKCKYCLYPQPVAKDFSG